MSCCADKDHPLMRNPVAELKSFLAKRKLEIAAAHRSGRSGLEICTDLSLAMDESIRLAFGSIAPGEQEHVAVLALGGYGRAELCPRSDVDIMILCETGEQRAQAEKTAGSFLRVLWDAGVDAGHSVRTIEQAEGLHGQSLDSWTGMLEGRHVCGNKELSNRFFGAIRRRITTDKWLIEGVLADLQNRHRQYGNSVKLLEPNVKKSAGGLRDLHAVFWLFRGTDPDFFIQEDQAVPASGRFLEMLQKKGLIIAEELEEALSAVGFLLRTRHEMHYQRESLHDTLEYGLQLKVAESLNAVPTNSSSAVEVFMRSYYLHARVIDRLSRRLGRQFCEVLAPAHHDDGIEQLGDHLLLSGLTISTKPGIRRFSNAVEVFEAFVHAAENDAELDFRVHAAIEHSLDLLSPDICESPGLAALFRRILNSRRVGYTLHTMNELGVLGRYIPEFGELVAFFQHNVYHYFTADEHTLIAIAHAEDLREQRGVMREVFRNLRRKETLYLAILLHDIAKPHGVADHEIGGVNIAGDVLRRLGMEDALPDVSFLIRNHLLMEQVAFRRNIHDPETIKEFAARFERPEQLDYLYLLTYADLSAVNINVWTEWKSSMLQDLYLHTLEVLRRNLTGVEVDQFHRLRRESAVAEVVNRLSGDIPREQVEGHLSAIQSEAYVSLFSDQEIAQHIRKSTKVGPVSTLFNHFDGYSEVTVLGKDAPFFLSHCCAVLSANDANIFDANVFTRDDGVIIDRFRVSDTTTKRRLEDRVCTKIDEELRKVVDGEVDVQDLFEAHRRRWKRRVGLPVNPNVRIDVEFEDAPRFTIIDVFAPDSVGFLYRITEAISRLGLSIHFAKIATRADGVVDAFYVVDTDGNPITQKQRREEIRQEVLVTIKTLSEEQLT